MASHRPGPRKKRSMTTVEFESVRPLLKISEDRIKAAQMVLVENQTYEGVGKIFNQTKQAVSDSVSVVWAEFQRWQLSQAAAGKEPVPKGWRKVVLIAPEALVESFYAQIAEARSAADTTIKKPAKKPAKKE